MQSNFEAPKRVIRSRKLMKDKQDNGQKENNLMGHKTLTEK